MSQSLSPYLRSKIHGLRVTAIETKFDLTFSGAMVIGPRLGWAASLGEFDRVEVYNMVRCETTHLHVFYGAEGKVEVWLPGPQRTQVGDTVRVMAHAWLDPVAAMDLTAAFVLVGKANAPIEIRRIASRRARIDPSFCPLPPREEKCERLATAPRPSVSA